MCVVVWQFNLNCEISAVFCVLFALFCQIFMTRLESTFTVSTYLGKALYYMQCMSFQILAKFASSSPLFCKPLTCPSQTSQLLHSYYVSIILEHIWCSITSSLSISFVPPIFIYVSSVFIFSIAPNQFALQTTFRPSFVVRIQLFRQPHPLCTK